MRLSRKTDGEARQAYRQIDKQAGRQTDRPATYLLAAELVVPHQLVARRLVCGGLLPLVVGWDALDR